MGYSIKKTTFHNPWEDWKKRSKVVWDRISQRLYYLYSGQELLFLNHLQEYTLLESSSFTVS